MKSYTLADATQEAMKKFNIRASKKYGQNFLIDDKVLENILNTAQVDKKDCILEIGPGLGTMTRLLCERANKVVAVEIDRQMINALKINMFDYKNFNLINEDIMKLDIKALLEDNFGDRKCKVVANLPYYITSPIIMKLLEERLNLHSITLMVQKEVAQRIAAAPGGKEYGALSVAVQYYSIPKITEIVPKTAFMPQPGVDSAVIHLFIRNEPPIKVLDELMLFRVIRASFAQRRKTLLNSLQGSDLGLERKDGEIVLKNCGIEPRRRGETLSLEEFGLLSDEIGLFLKKK